STRDRHAHPARARVLTDSLRERRDIVVPLSKSVHIVVAEPRRRLSLLPRTKHYYVGTISEAELKVNGFEIDHRELRTYVSQQGRNGNRGYVVLQNGTRIPGGLRGRIVLAVDGLRQPVELEAERITSINDW
ncbi:MAG: hypothetical protein KGS61_12695, partial [Verrucomicrobia bacterium]|nr:hypothetical protein [Verrucomicrobiota bacterium]